MNWLVATRAASHATVALLITFTYEHDGFLGLTSLMLFGALYLASSIGTHLIDKRRKISSPAVALPVLAPILVATLAAISIALVEEQLLAFRWLLAVLMVGFVVTELFVAKKAGRKSVDGKEAIFTAVASAIMLGLAIGVDVGERPLIGFFGAYLAILAVHLGISAATPKK